MTYVLSMAVHYVVMCMTYLFMFKLTIKVFRNPTKQDIRNCLRNVLLNMLQASVYINVWISIHRQWYTQTPTHCSSEDCFYHLCHFYDIRSLIK